MTYKEFIEKYGDCLVMFKSYYKFSFMFSNDSLTISVGGDSDDIYRLNVKVDKEYRVADLEPDGATIDGKWHRFRY